MLTDSEPDSCPNCDGWNYSLYLWNEQIGRFDDSYSRIEADTKRSLVDTIKMHNGESIFTTDTDFPVLFCSATNWRPRPFMRLLDFLAMLDSVKTPDFSELAFAEAQNIFDFRRMEYIDETDQIKHEQVNAFLRTRPS